jgi:hypothetical protein
MNSRTRLDYARVEYGCSPEELKKVSAVLHAEARKEIRAGRARTFAGDIESCLEHDPLRTAGKPRSNRPTKRS